MSQQPASMPERQSLYQHAPASVRAHTTDQHAEVNVLTTRIDVATLSFWARTLCGNIEIRAVGVLQDLGIYGNLVEVHGQLKVLPPPPGTDNVDIDLLEGLLSSLRLVPVAPSLIYADLEAEFGPGTELPRVHPSRPHIIAYLVSSPGAPFDCDILAFFSESPSFRSPAIEIVLRPRSPIGRPAASVEKGMDEPTALEYCKRGCGTKRV